LRVAPRARAACVWPRWRRPASLAYCLAYPLALLGPEYTTTRAVPPPGKPCSPRAPPPPGKPCSPRAPPPPGKPCSRLAGARPLRNPAWLPPGKARARLAAALLAAVGSPCMACSECKARARACLAHGRLHPLLAPRTPCHRHAAYGLSNTEYGGGASQGGRGVDHYQL
jgi:hypothetical protein